MTIRKPWSFVILGLLAVSLVLNFAIGGFALTRAFGPPFEGGGRDRMLAGILKPFPEPLRDEIKDELEKDRATPERKAVFAEIRAARQAFILSLGAKDFDRTAVDAAAARLDAAVSSLNRHFSTVVIDTIGRASPEVRARITLPPEPRGDDGPPPGPAPGLFAPPPPGPPPRD